MSSVLIIWSPAATAMPLAAPSVVPEPLLYYQAAYASPSGVGIAGVASLTTSPALPDVLSRLAQSGPEARGDPLAVDACGSEGALYERVLTELLRTPPTAWAPPAPGSTFFLTADEACTLGTKIIFIELVNIFLLGMFCKTNYFKYFQCSPNHVQALSRRGVAESLSAWQFNKLKMCS